MSDDCPTCGRPLDDSQLRGVDPKPDAFERLIGALDRTQTTGVGSAGGRAGRPSPPAGRERVGELTTEPDVPLTPPTSSRIFHIIVPLRPPSLNDLNRKYRDARWARAAIKREWMPWFRGVTAYHRALGGRTVRFTRLLGHGERPYDDDNFTGGLKPIRDLLKTVRLIVDDDPDSARFLYSQSETLRYKPHHAPEPLPALVIEVFEWWDRDPD